MSLNQFARATCPIAQEKIQSIFYLGCHHKFERLAVLDWLATSLTCPLCRAKQEPIEKLKKNQSALNKWAMDERLTYVYESEVKRSEVEEFKRVPIIGDLVRVKGEYFHIIGETKTQWKVEKMVKELFGTINHALSGSIDETNYYKISLSKSEVHKNISKKAVSCVVEVNTVAFFVIREETYID